MEIRNAVRLSPSRIDCEIEHPVFGWVPFTASENDPEEVGRTIYTAAAGTNPPDYIAPEVDEPTEAEQLASERAAMVCSRFQAKAALHLAGLLDTIEAVVASADPVAQIAWADAAEFRRNSPTIADLAAGAGLTDAQIDDLFRVAATITA
jgi:hypothetical protein